MGLFDRIKKSLFGKKDDEEEKKEEQEKQEEVEQKQDDSEAVAREEQSEESAESDKREETEPIEEDKESEASGEVAEDEEEPESEETAEIEEEQETEPQESETTEEAETETDEEEPETEELEEDEDSSQEELYEKGLEKTNKGFGARLNAFFAKFRTVDEDFFDDLEDLLIESDVGYETAEQLTDELREEAKLQNARSRDDLKKVIVEKLVDRCTAARDAALTGKQVAVISSGDAGIYGMASLMFEVCQAYPEIQIEVIPGITAACSGGAVLGSPLTNDFAVISLSDLLTPWQTIERRLYGAAQGDFCICLYNPASKRRTDHLQKACDILLKERRPETPCGLVRNIGRDGQTMQIMTLQELRDTQVDMLTTVFVGNSMTRIIDGHMVTPRGYQGV